MVYETLRESFFGQIVYYASRGKLFSYPEERPDFVLPERYKQACDPNYKRPGEGEEDRDGARGSRQWPISNEDARRPEREWEQQGQPRERDQAREGGQEQAHSEPQRSSSEETVVGDQGERRSGEGEKKGKRTGSGKEQDKAKGGKDGKEGKGGEEGKSAEDQRSEAANKAHGADPVPGILKDDCYIVTWYTDDDPENPLNWGIFKKCWTTAMIMLMTISIYMGSSIFSPAIMDAVQYFGLGQVPTTLGISLFVIGYGVGPLFLSPLSEIPQIGRNIPYIITLALFTILQVPTALVTNFAGFAILRFLAGFIGSPPLATGGASLQDVFSPHKLPYAMGLYGIAAASSPALAPIISGFAVEAEGWRWAFWIMLWLSGGSLLILIFFLPETSANNILLRRARRLRKLTGNDKITAASEIVAANMTPYQIVQMTLIRPLVMTFTEPVVLACDLYIGLVYAVLYSYFESFPLVYAEGYGWSLGVSNLPFVSLFIGAFLAYAGYCIWNRLYFEERFFREKASIRPEARLPMLIPGSFAFPICLFWFAWTANRTLWISPVIATAFFGVGATWSFMPILTYLPNAYPAVAASVLASNDFFRSMMGGAMPIVANPLFKNLGVDWGNTLLGCLTVLFLPLPWLLIRFGPALRARSPNALHDEQLEEMKPDALKREEEEEKKKKRSEQQA